MAAIRLSETGKRRWPVFFMGTESTPEANQGTINPRKHARLTATTGSYKLYTVTD